MKWYYQLSVPGRFTNCAKKGQRWMKREKRKEKGEQRGEEREVRWEKLSSSLLRTNSCFMPTRVFSWFFTDGFSWPPVLGTSPGNSHARGSQPLLRACEWDQAERHHPVSTQPKSPGWWCVTPKHPPPENHLQASSRQCAKTTTTTNRKWLLPRCAKRIAKTRERTDTHTHESRLHTHSLQSLFSFISVTHSV